MILINKIVAAFAVWTMICAGVVVFAIGPAVANLFVIEAGIREQDDRIVASASRIKQIEAFNEFSKTQGGNLAKIDSLFIDARSPKDIFDFLENSAKNTGVKLEISSSSDVFSMAKVAWPSFNFQMTLTGGFSSILKFVKSIETGKYLVSASNLSIVDQQVADSGQSKLVSEGLKASVTLSIYVINKNDGNEKK